MKINLILLFALCGVTLSQNPQSFGQFLGAFNQQCKPPPSDAACQHPQAIASSNPPGFTVCEQDYECCMCGAIQCGSNVQGCTRLSAGPSGMFGVKQVSVLGEMTMGATIDCLGMDSCAQTIITGVHINGINAIGDGSLRDAKVTVYNPSEEFSLECLGISSCSGLTLEIIIPGPANGMACDPNYRPRQLPLGYINCAQQESCSYMRFSFVNEGCDSYEFDSLSCIQGDSCYGATFDFVGEVEVTACELSGTGHTVTGISKCFENLDRLICSEPSSCRGAHRAITNPANNFMLSCEGTGACYNAVTEIDLNVNAAEPILNFEALKFLGEASGASATIIIRNDQNGQLLTIDRIECLALESCAGTTFVTGYYVGITEIICHPGACFGCKIKTFVDDVAYVPCDPKQDYVVPPPGNQLPAPQQPAPLPIVPAPLPTMPVRLTPYPTIRRTPYPTIRRTPRPTTPRPTTPPPTTRAPTTPAPTTPAPTNYWQNYQPVTPGQPRPQYTTTKATQPAPYPGSQFINTYV